MSTQFDLQNKVAFISGGTGYLGKSMVEGLAKAKCRVYVNGRNEQKLLPFIEACSEDGLDVRPALFDITDHDQCAYFFENFDSSQLNIIVNNAYNGTAGSVETSDSSDYQKSYDISLISTHRIMQMALPLLRESAKQMGDASVINIASMYGMVSPDLQVYESKSVSNPPFYGAAKAAMIQWTRYAACEFAREKIRVNAISPGAFPATAVQEANSDFIKRLENKVPMGRIGKPEELKGVLLFLASTASSYVTGVNIPVDGGWTAW